MSTPLRLNAGDIQALFARLGPSLGLWRAAEIAALREQVYPPPVLDLGCGDGLVTSFVLKQVAVGLDPDQEALQKAAALGIYRELAPYPVQEARLPPGSLGAIMSNSVLEHVPAIDQALGAAARLLRPGGNLVFTTPTEAFSRWLALPSRHYRQLRNQQYGHRNLWAADEWAHRLKGVGVEVVEVRPYLRRSLVTLWDALELVQSIWIARRRLFGLAWRRLPQAWLARLARYVSAWDLSSDVPGGGQLIMARKPS